MVFMVYQGSTGTPPFIFLPGRTSRRIASFFRPLSQKNRIHHRLLTTLRDAEFQRPVALTLLGDEHNDDPRRQ